MKELKPNGGKTEAQISLVVRVKKKTKNKFLIKNHKDNDNGTSAI